MQVEAIAFGVSATYHTHESAQGLATETGRKQELVGLPVSCVPGAAGPGCGARRPPSPDLMRHCPARWDKAPGKLVGGRLRKKKKKRYPHH